MIDVKLIGAIIGDIMGSIYEFNPVSARNFRLLNNETHFTDDTVLTIAVADAIINKKDFAITLKEYVRKYPNMTYGANFIKWAKSYNSRAYNSFGNGSAMRVSLIPFLSNSLEEALNFAEESANITHNHPEGIKGAKAIVHAIWLAKIKSSKETIKNIIEQEYGYNLSISYEDLRKKSKYSEICQNSVPEAIISFLYSGDYASAIRNAIWLKTDADTVACITGGIAISYYEKLCGHELCQYENVDQLFINKLPKEFLDILNQI